MIDYLEVENFRAFKHERFEFSKINIFVGPNNSGKSSALSALNVLAQTMENPFLGNGHIVLNGRFDQLGTFKDMVHGGRANTPVRFTFGFRSKEIHLEFKYRSQRRELELTRFKLSHRGKSIYEYRSSKDKYDIFIGSKKIEQLLPLGIKKRPRFAGFIPIFREGFRYRRTYEDDQPEISEEAFEAIRRAETQLNHLRFNITDIFRNFESLGPFRHVPQRTYLYSGETASHVGRAGENTVSLLAGDNAKRGSERLGFVEEVTRWMKATNISKGIKVKNLTDRHFEISIIGKNGIDHNICDVGFGCSQVLPVLVAGINHKQDKSERAGNILVVQEPEIHLHPNAQAALGSFFANVSSGRGPVFLETHSDNLVLRVARHVALGDLKPSDVSIFFVEDIAGEKKVTKVTITDEGAFSPEWPGGFFPQRQSESFALARASLKDREERQRKLSSNQLEFTYPSEQE